MARARPIIRDAILPLIVFSCLVVLANRFIFGHLFKSGLAKHLASACTPTNSPTTKSTMLPYTGLLQIDALLCPFVTFFHAAIEEPDAFSFLTYFIGIGSPLIAIPAVESSRAGRSVFIAYPIIFGLLSQTITVGMTFPIYWLSFMLSGGANTGSGGRLGDAKITQAHAEATIFGLIVGATIPSIGLLVLGDPQITAIWQPYPVYVSIAQFVHLTLRPASKHSESGYKTIRFLYLSVFIICSYVHISTIWPLITDFHTIQRVYLPSTTIPEQSTLAGIRVLHFLKWDLALGFGSSILATLWFASNLTEIIILAMWNMIATPVLGPGAALWRESSLQDVSVLKVKET